MSFLVLVLHFLLGADHVCIPPVDFVVEIPASRPARADGEAARDEILELIRVENVQIHAGHGPHGFVQPADAVARGHLPARALRGNGEARMLGAEVVHLFRMEAGIDAAEIHVPRLPVCVRVEPREPGFHVAPRLRPVVVHEPARVRRAPRTDAHPEMVQLDVHSHGEELRLRRHGAPMIGLPLIHDDIRPHAVRFVFPWLSEPAVHEVHEQLRRVFHGEKFRRDVPEEHPRRVQRRQMEAHGPHAAFLFVDLPPFPVADHVHLVPVVDMFVTVRAFVVCRVQRFLRRGPFRPLDLLHFELLIGAAEGTGHEIFVLRVGPQPRLPDISRLERRRGDPHELPVPESLRAFRRQLHRTGLVAGPLGKFVDFIKKDVPYRPRRQICRRICTYERNIHLRKLQLQPLAVIFQKFDGEGR